MSAAAVQFCVSLLCCATGVEGQERSPKILPTKRALHPLPEGPFQPFFLAVNSFV